MRRPTGASGATMDGAHSATACDAARSPRSPPATRGDSPWRAGGARRPPSIQLRLGAPRGQRLGPVSAAIDTHRYRSLGAGRRTRVPAATTTLGISECCTAADGLPPTADPPESCSAAHLRSRRADPPAARPAALPTRRAGDHARRRRPRRR